MSTRRLLELNDEQVLWGMAEMLLRRYGARAGELVTARARDLRDDGDELASALYSTVARRIDEISRSGSSH